MLFACGETVHIEEQEPVSDEFKLVDFDSFSYQNADLAESASVTILSFSGGPECNNDVVYYKQFIVIADSTKDTLRVLSPCQAYDGTIYSGLFSKNLEQELPLAKQYLENRNKQIIFNKNNALESGQYKTIIGSISFK